MSEQSHMAALLKAVTSQSTDQQKKSDIKFQKNIIIKRKNSKQSELLEQQQTSKKIHISQNSGKKVINEKPQNETEDNIPQKDSKKAKKRKNKQQNNQQQQFLSNWEQFKQKESNNNETKSTNNINNNNNNNKNNSNNNIINNNNLNIYSLTPSLKSFKGPTPIVALDCEMVMCEDFEQGQKHFLARISIVNYNGHVLLDQYVNPRRKVVNYLTWVSGIKPHHIIGAPSLEDLMPKLKSILDDKIIVGHSIKNDFDVMFYYPASKYIRDIAKFSFLKNQSTGKTLSLKNMNQQFLNLSIQNGQHSSVEDARASMLIYRKFEKQIEESVKNQGYNGIKNRLLNDIKK